MTDAEHLFRASLTEVFASRHGEQSDRDREREDPALRDAWFEDRLRDMPRVVADVDGAAGGVAAHDGFSEVGNAAVQAGALRDPIALEALSFDFILIDDGRAIERHPVARTGRVTFDDLFVLLDFRRDHAALCDRPPLHGGRIAQGSDDDREDDESESAKCEGRENVVGHAIALRREPAAMGGDLPQVLPRIPHHCATITVWRVLRLFNRLRTAIHSAAKSRVGVLDVDVEKGGHCVALQRRTDHEERVADSQFRRPLGLESAGSAEYLLNESYEALRIVDGDPRDQRRPPRRYVLRHSVDSTSRRARAATRPARDCRSPRRREAGACRRSRP